MKFEVVDDRFLPASNKRVQHSRVMKGDADKPLRAFLREQENAALAAGNMNWMRHESPEGGTDTVGFGHKMSPKEHATGKINGISVDRMTLQDAEVLLQEDINAKKASLDKSLRKKHNIPLAALSQREQMMLLDYEYNLGSAIKQFPSFTKGVLSGDEGEQIKEMTRYFTNKKGETQPLARNRAFYNTFMSPEAIQTLGR